MKNLSKIILSSIFAFLLAFSIAGCGPKDNGDNGNNGGNSGGQQQEMNVEQAFSKFETVYDNMSNYENSLTINILSSNFSGERKDQMNTDGYWLETLTNILSYDHNSGNFFSIDERWEYSRINYVSKLFDDDNIGHFVLLEDNSIQESLLVDKLYGAYKIKDNIFPNNKYDYSIFNEREKYSLLTHSAAIEAFQKAKDIIRSSWWAR